ncbi:MAG: S8 family serine peptidase, partial [Actinomycetota bacterium]|nr:S8 family serine peptidase [Actinomycetota bacterium]
MPKHFRWPVVVFAVLTALTVLTVSSAAVSRGPARPAVDVAVDGKLVQQLRASESGRVAAVVTAWNRRDLKKIQALGVRGVRLRVLPMILTRSLTSSQLEALERAPFVRSVWANRKYAVQMQDSTWLTRARYAWEGRDVAQSTFVGFPGATGKGVEIAVIDTGIDGQHEDADNLIEFCETIHALSSTRSTVNCSPYRPATGNAGPAGPCGAAPGTAVCLGLSPARADAYDLDVAHGTHVSGTIAGTGDASGGRTAPRSVIGVAPDAKLRVYSANVGGNLLAHEILSSYDDMTYKKLNGFNNVVAVSNSWGGGTGATYNPSAPIHIAIKRAHNAGILNVFAAGNAGPEHNTTSSQCVNPFVVCVAASTKLDSVAAFSSRGRPSEPQDTNANGRVGQPGATSGPAYDPGDVRPDNHDRRLGQALDLGLYRPTITAPGVNINAMKAIAANIGDPTAVTCREADVTPDTNCYVAISGTSMATPHVSGVVALVTQAYRQTHPFSGNPSPAILTQILERSANLRKLPGLEAEEQGVGRLDALEAVKFARSYPNLPRGTPATARTPNLGYPTPPYEPNRYPTAPGSITSTQKGCTLPASWPAASPPASPVEPPVDMPAIGPGVGWGQHFIFVPPKSERLRITVRWPLHPTANIYLRLWRPGVDPNVVNADQENAGLAQVVSARSVEVRAPEESRNDEGAGPPPAIPSGYWILRVYHRVGGEPLPCTPGNESPPRAPAPGYNYNVSVETPTVDPVPAVSIQRPAPGTNLGTGRFVTFEGNATYPTPWEGITNWEVPGSSPAAAGGGGTGEPDPANDTRTILYFHGNPHVPEDADTGDPAGEPNEELCTGIGQADVEICGGPFLIPSADLYGGTPASWQSGEHDVLADNGARSLVDPNWVWCLDEDQARGCGPLPENSTYTRRGPTTVEGPMTVQWWASCLACPAAIGFTADWWIRLWADGRLAFEQRVTATPSTPGVASELKTVVNLPRIRAERNFSLHVDPVYIDSQAIATIYYDSSGPCQEVTTGACDSLVKMPVVPEGTPENRPPDVPANVRVTD